MDSLLRSCNEGMTIRVVIVSGIYPPDIGGPATHANEVRNRLDALGHTPIVLSLHNARRSQYSSTDVRISRTWPWPFRFLGVISWLIWNKNQYDVVYATGMQTEAAIGSKLARRPVLLKIVGDPAWERGRRLGLVDAEFDDFQRGVSGGIRVWAMRAARNLAVVIADAVTVPSEYLSNIVRGWADGLRIGPDPVVVRNGVPLEAIPETRMDPSSEPLRAIYVGRLVDHKRVEILVCAVSRTPSVTLTIVGDGPTRQRLQHLVAELGIERRVEFTGSVDHRRVLTLMAESHVMVTAASYEGLPHTALEALACGTPVLASAAGGTGEAVIDEINGSIVDPATPERFASELTRLEEDRERLRWLMDGARESARSWSMQENVRKIESLLMQIVVQDSVVTSE